MRSFLKVSLLLILFASNAYAQNYCPLQNKHVLLIGLDGTRRDAFNQAYLTLKNNHSAENFIQLIDDGAIDNHIYAGGHLNDDSKQLTLSEPGWVTILTGAWAEHHHIRYNGDLNRGKYNRNYPTIYNYIKHYRIDATTASFTDWQPLQIVAGYNFYGDDAASINRLYTYKNDSELLPADKKMTQDVVASILQNNPPTFIFVHYLDPDETGHQSGFDPNNPHYMSALTSELYNVDTLAAAIKASENNGNQWLVIIATDHGGHSIVHGTQQKQDRDIFAVFNAKDTLYSGGLQLSLVRGQTLFVPTILDFLNITSCQDKLDGKKL